MDQTVRPIATSFTLSALLHGVVLAALLVMYHETGTSSQGIDIQLISSIRVSDQQENEIADKKMQTRPLPEVSQQTTVTENKNRTFGDQPFFDRLTVNSSEHDSPLLPPVTTALKTPEVETDVNDFVHEQASHEQTSIDDGEQSALLTQSSNAVNQQAAILSLLHESISSHKEYPYIARRQRREGIATVAFVLHPDGSIENTHLVASSRAMALDRAAITAVKDIEPFEPAAHYLEHAESFKIDVVFKLL